ncbi:MAG: AI-2E family transporter [Rhodospirillales bacterium]|nr:AI-2E family transporter [Rhodospirillales bacterium]
MNGQQPQIQPFSWNRIAAWVAIFAAFLLFVYLLSGVLLPFVVAAAIAYLIDPLVDRLEKIGVPRVGGAAIVTITFFAVAAIVLILLAPVLQHQIVGLGERLTVVVRQLVEIARPHVEELFAQVGPVDVQQFSGAGDAVRTAIGWIARAVGGVVSGGLAVVNVLALIFITPVVVFYLVRDWKHVETAIDEWLPRQHAVTIRGLLGEIDARLAGFLRGQALVCLFLATFYAIGLTIADLNYGLLVGIMTGLLSFIPYVGAFVGMVTAIVIAVFQFPTWLEVGGVLAVFVLGQFLEGNFVTPKLVGDRVGLHPVWMLLAVFAGGALFGFVGVLIAIPVAAALGVLFRFAMGRYRASSLYLGNDGT